MSRTDDVLAKMQCPCCHQSSLDPRLVPLIVLLEEKLDKIFTITSGYRCKRHNLDLIKQGYPASFKSLHMQGLAVDVFCMKKHQVVLVEAARKIGFMGIGIGNNFVHLDLRESPAEWWY